jgi:broad specificity phosphatase PhoE
MSQKQTIIYLVRHGESESNRNDLVSGGGNNPSLTRKGERQALDTKKQLNDINFHEVYSSDLKRASKTAEIVSGKVIHPAKQLKKLREKHFGSLEGTSAQNLDEDAEIRRNLPKSESWAYKHLYDIESDQELADRIISQIEELAIKHAGQTLLIGSHGTAIRVILMKLQDKHYKDMPKEKFRNGGYIKLIYINSSLIIVEVNGYN